MLGATVRRKIPFQGISSGTPKGLSPPASQLNNTVHHHSRQQLHHDVTSSRKRNRSRSPSPQLVKMYSAGAPRPVTPRGSALSPVAHGVNSICLPPGSNNSPHASRTYFDQGLCEWRRKFGRQKFCRISKSRSFVVRNFVVLIRINQRSQKDII